MNYEQELDKLMAPLLEEIEKDLNKWSVPKAEKMPGNTFNIPTIVRLGSYQVCPKSGTFELDAPTAGMVKDIAKTKEQLESPIVIRRVVGYVGAARAVGEGDPKKLLPFLKEMVETLKKAKGYDNTKLVNGTYATFKHPDGGYFKWMEDAYAYELRLYSDCTLAETV